MLFDFLPFFNPTIPQGTFERSVFSLVERHIADRKPVEEELQGVSNLQKIPVSDNEKRQKFAAELYLLLERNIAEEQSRGRVPKEVLREQILHHCHPERAQGNFALMFLPHYERQIHMFERFAEMVFENGRNLMNPKEFSEFMELLGTDPLWKGLIKNNAVAWKRVAKSVHHYTPPVRRDVTQNLLKRAFALLSSRLIQTMGELRVEVMFRDTYRRFHDALDFIEDSPKVLLTVPENFLADERVGLLGKRELEEQLRLKNQELETTAAELQGEKLKLSEMTREELEAKVQERTAALVKALTQVEAAQKQLEEAKAKDDAFLENIGDGLIAIDADWKIILWNQAATEISGWTRNEAMGRSFKEYINFAKENDSPVDTGFVEKALSSGAFTHAGDGPNDELSLVRRDKVKVAVAASASPITDNIGKVSSVIIVFRDISSERELQKAREEFSSLATHELRTPVAAIKGYIKLILSGTAGTLHEKQKKYLEQVDRANERLLTLVNAMLDVSRIELGTLAISPAPTVLSTVAEGVLSDLAPKIADKKQTIEKHYDAAVPEMTVDPSLVHAIFENLISNAVKYTPEGGTIKVLIEKKDPDVAITVSDNGYGIPVADQPKIFEKMFRADNARAKVIEGTGLGLYLVKSILDQTHGKIWFESEENKGTTFHVTMPLTGMQKREGLKGLS